MLDLKYMKKIDKKNFKETGWLNDGFGGRWLPKRFRK